MSAVRLFLCFSIVIFFSCSNSSEQQQRTVFKQVPEIQEIKPEKPVKIKLKRNAKDDYSWEINGDQVEEVIVADRKLRKGLKAD